MERKFLLKIGTKLGQMITKEGNFFTKRSIRGLSTINIVKNVPNLCILLKKNDQMKNLLAVKFFKKLISVPGRLLGTLEYFTKLVSRMILHKNQTRYSKNRFVWQFEICIFLLNLLQKKGQYVLNFGLLILWNYLRNVKICWLIPFHVE